MPRQSWTTEQERQYEYIRDSEYTTLSNMLERKEFAKLLSYLDNRAQGPIEPTSKRWLKKINDAIIRAAKRIGAATVNKTRSKIRAEQKLNSANRLKDRLRQKVVQK